MTQREQDELSKLTLEEVVTGKGYADLPASPLQRAVCRAVCGELIGDLLSPEECERYFGMSEPVAAGEVPSIVELVVGIRGGKSFVLACACIRSAHVADLSALKPHEIPRAVIVGPTVDAAAATFRLLLGILQSSPVLRRFIDGEPTSDTVMIKRADERRVEICVVAAHRGGLSVRNRWLVFFGLEEVALFGTEASGAVVNVEDLYNAARTRLLPGCQGWLVSSPYGPQGLLHGLWKKHFGRRGSVLVVHAPTRALNPSFAQAQIDAIRAENPDVAAREYDAAWLDADSAYYAVATVDPAIRHTPLELIARAAAVGMDPGTRSNTWTVAVAWPEHAPNSLDFRRQRVIVGAVWSWQGSRAAPLSPRATLREIARRLEPYQIKTIYCDGWSFDAMQDHAEAAGLKLIEQPASERDLPYQRLHTLLANGDVELPPEPTLRTDLLAVRQRVTAGGIKIYLPHTPNGRHCDLVPAVALAVTHAQGSSNYDFEAANRTMENIMGMSDLLDIARSRQ